jgi:tetratricopeptide (TPR) repeat protein
MELQAALGVALMFTRGNSPATHDALARGLAIADDRDAAEPQLRLLGAFVVFHDRVGQFRESVAIARRSEPAARRLGEPAALMISDWIIGTSVHLLGDQAEAERRCRSATTAEAKLKHIAPYHYGFDHRIRGLVALGRVLWLVGRPEEAMRVAHQTIREGEDLHHPVSLAISLGWTSSVFAWSGDHASAADIIERLIVHAQRHSLGPYVHVGLGLRGELAVKRGDPEAGLALLRRAQDALQHHHHGILDTVFATAEAEALGLLGRLPEAVRVIEQAIACAERKGGSFDLAEMLRLEASFAAVGTPDEAEPCYTRALHVARTQGALGWELRVATSLARFWIARGQVGAADDLVRATLARFTDGFQTADLVAAQALLADRGGRSVSTD